LLTTQMVGFPPQMVGAQLPFLIHNCFIDKTTIRMG
jgi:hypothetical protein